ncbi:MAG: hypothetical protein FJ280_23060 [Planctomycetes bacterium]|nr:hypothetical protein [Planctomycetota bacterium]
MKKSAMARIVEFDLMVRLGRYPSRMNFSVDYGVTERTVARDIEYLRDRLQAPLEYDTNRRGYFYSKKWELPSVVSMSGMREDKITGLIGRLRALPQDERDFVIQCATNSIGSETKPARVA